MRISYLKLFILILVLLGILCYNQPAETQTGNYPAVKTIAVRSEKSITDFKPEDFTVFENGKKMDIIQIEKIENTLPSPEFLENQVNRFIFFLFNFTEYDIHMSEVVDLIFNRVIKKGDRVVYLINGRTIQAHTVHDPGSEKSDLVTFLKKNCIEIDAYLTKMFKIMDNLIKSGIDRITRIQLTETDHPHNLPEMLDYGKMKFDKYLKLLTYYKKTFLFPNPATVASLLQKRNEKENRFVFQVLQIQRFPVDKINMVQKSRMKKIIKDSRYYSEVVSACARAGRRMHETLES